MEMGLQFVVVDDDDDDGDYYYLSLFICVVRGEEEYCRISEGGILTNYYIHTDVSGFHHFLGWMNNTQHIQIRGAPFVILIVTGLVGIVMVK
jgi:hypothetical protein